MPLLPDLQFGTIDVRDVALAHWRALEKQSAQGHRHILVNKNFSVRCAF